MEMRSHLFCQNTIAVLCLFWSDLSQPSPAQGEARFPWTIHQIFKTTLRTLIITVPILRMRAPRFGEIKTGCSRSNSEWAVESVSSHRSFDNLVHALNHHDGTLHPLGCTAEREAERNFRVSTVYILGAIQEFSEALSTYCAMWLAQELCRAH